MKNSISILSVLIALAIVPSISCSAVSKTKPSPVLKPSAKPQSPTVPVIAKPKAKPGTVLWEFTTDKARYIEGSPSFFDGNVYFGSGGNARLYVVDAITGKLNWTPKLPHSSEHLYSTVVIDNGLALFGTQRGGVVYAYDIKQREVRWKSVGSPIDAGYGSQAVGADGTIYHPAGNPIGGGNKAIYALESKTGKIRWSFLTKNLVTSTPVVSSDNVVYVGSTDGYFYALEGETGQLKWKYTGDDISSFRGGDTDHQAAIGSDGTLYVCALGRSKSNYVIALNPKNGKEKWKVEGIASTTSPSIGADGTIFVTGNRKLYALKEDSGEKKWEFSTDGGTSSTAVGDNGVVYFGSGDRDIYAVDGKTGKKKWSVRTGDSVYTSPVLSDDGILYVGSRDGRLYAIATSSTGPAKSPWPMFGQNAQRTSRAPAAK